MLKLYGQGSNNSMATGHLRALVSLLGLPEFNNSTVYFDEEARKEIMNERGLSSIVIGHTLHNMPIIRLECYGWYVECAEEDEGKYLITKIYSGRKVIYKRPNNPSQVLRIGAEP